MFIPQFVVVVSALLFFGVLCFLLVFGITDENADDDGGINAGFGAGGIGLKMFCIELMIAFAIGSSLGLGAFVINGTKQLTGANRIICILSLPLG